MENKITREEIVASLSVYNKKVKIGRTIHLITSFIILCFVLAIFVYLKFFNTQFEVSDGVISVNNSTAWVIRIPAEYQGEQITEFKLPEGSWPDARFLYIEDGIERIHGELLFLGNDKIVAVRLPNTLNYISSNAFAKYYSLRKVYWDAPPENTVIGRMAFMYTNIREFTIPEGVTCVGDMCFFDCDKLEKVTMPDSLKKLGVGTFAYCGELETVQLPENIDLVPDFLFMECEKLKTVEMGDNIRAIGRFSFFNTCVTQEQYPENLYYASYHTADATDEPSSWIEPTSFVCFIVGHEDYVTSKIIEYDTIYYDKEKEKEFFAEKNGAPLEVFDEPVNSDRIWMEGKYYKLPLKQEDFFGSDEWEVIEEDYNEYKNTTYYTFRNRKSGHVMNLDINNASGAIVKMYVRYHKEYCSIVLPGGIPVGDSLGHYYCLEEYLDVLKNREFITDSERFLIGPEDCPVECEYFIERDFYDHPIFTLDFE